MFLCCYVMGLGPLLLSILGAMEMAPWFPI
jgi:hypothetical protein